MSVASVTIAGSSMSALLWTILSSSWGGLGLRPGPANSEREGQVEEDGQTQVQRDTFFNSDAASRTRQRLIHWSPTWLKKGLTVVGSLIFSFFPKERRFKITLLNKRNSTRLTVGVGNGPLDNMVHHGKCLLTGHLRGDFGNEQLF